MAKRIIMVGSDVSGELHLGHLALLSVARGISDWLSGKLMVSLNEVESICSRDNNLKQVYQNQKKITDFFMQNGVAVHSRAGDEALLMFALRIWKMIQADPKKLSSLCKYYELKLGASDALSVIIMAVTPLLLAHGEKADEVIMVYGADEASHLNYIVDLYQQAWFKREVKTSFGTVAPKLNYILIKLVPDLTGKFKMGKTRVSSSVLIKNLSAETRLTQPVLDYLFNLVEVLAPLPHASKNPFLNKVGEVVF